MAPILDPAKHLMGKLFGGVKVPAPPTHAEAEIDTAAEEAARAEAERLRKRRGYKSTIFTGPQGVTTPPSVHKTILG